VNSPNVIAALLIVVLLFAFGTVIAAIRRNQTTFAGLKIERAISPYFYWSLVAFWLFICLFGLFVLADMMWSIRQ
jgi:hypothetical protein